MVLTTLAANKQASSNVRRATRNGRQYLVAPLTTIVPGILHGSKGALFYPAEEVRRSAKDWDDIPLVVYHPTRNGLPASASDPGVLRRQGIGFLHASAFRDKLVHEGWFDIEATRRVDPRVLAALERGEPIELSTGLYTDNEPSPGTHNGKPYDFIARNLIPDHLAILPDQVGACSLNDGCGVLVNHEESEMFDENDLLEIPTINYEACSRLHTNCCDEDGEAARNRERLGFGEEEEDDDDDDEEVYNSTGDDDLLPLTSEGGY